MLLNPAASLRGAKDGILLWYNAVLPSLLPYMIISNIVILSGISGAMSLMAYPVTYLLKIPSSAGYCITSGIFFGYPACALSATQMYRRKIIDKDTACFCACAFNNVSPGFLSGFICIGMLESAKQIPVIFILFYITLLLSTSIIRITLFRKKINKSAQTAVSYEAQNSHILDTAVMNALTAIAKLCGYIVIFSILCSFIKQIPLKGISLLCGLIEVTSGSTIICHLNLPMRIKYLFLIPVLSFGGISGIYQTFGVDEEKIIDRKKYIMSKVIAAFVGFVITYIYGRIFM